MHSLIMPRSSGALFLALILLLLWPQAAHCQDEASLRVMVTAAEDGRSFPGVNVILTDTESDTLYTGATNLDGYHEITGLTSGTYELILSHVGYETYRQELELRAETYTHRVELGETAEELGELLVEDERGAAQRVAGMQRVSPTDIGRIPTPGPGGDLATYLQTMPGVVTGGDRGGELHIRGGTPSQNLILVDNLPIVKPFHISNLYSAFPEAIVQNVDLYAGGFGAEYMGATSSVVDVRLREGNMREYQGTGSASSYLMSLHAEGPISQQESFLFSARHSIIEELAGPVYGREVPLHFYDLTGRYSLNLENAACNVTGLHTYDRGQIHPERQTELTWSNLTVGGRCLLHGGRFERAFDVNVGFTQFDNTAGSIGQPERDAGIRQAYFNLDHEHNLLGHTMEYGLRWSVQHYWADLDDRFAAVETFDTFGSTIKAYTGMHWEPSDYFSISPSIGSQLTTRREGIPTLEPRLRVSYRPDGTDRQEISAAAGNFHQLAEGITDERDIGTVFTVWSPTEVGEALPQALHGILGYRQRFGRFVEAGVESYVKQHTNMPVSRWTPEARFTTHTALADGLTYGADIRLELDRDPIYVFAGYEWSQVTYEAATGDLGAWIDEPVFSYSPPHDQRHQLSTVLSYRAGDFSASIRWEFGSGQPYTRVYGFDLALGLPEEHPRRDAGSALTLYHEPYADRLPAFHRLDISAQNTFEISPRFSLDAEAGVINLYDRRNIFSFDIDTFERVDQMPLLPYVSLSTSIQ